MLGERHGWLFLVGLVLVLPHCLAVQDFTEPGPCQTRSYSLVTKLPSESGCKLAQCLVPVTVRVPYGAGACGAGQHVTVFFFNAFQTFSIFYKDYQVRLATYGFASVAYDMGLGIVTDKQELSYRPYILSMLARENANPNSKLYNKLNLDVTATAGHSRGGKLATLVLTSDPKVQTAFLMDPVDNTQFSPVSENYPSAVAALEAGSYVAAVVGAGVTSGCNPADANYEQFFNAMAAGSWKETIEKASHVSFISPLIGLGDLSLGNLMTRVASIACGKARISNTDVVEYTSATLVAWMTNVFQPQVPLDGFYSYITGEQAVADSIEFVVKVQTLRG